LFNANRKLVSIVGQPEYMAPEITSSVEDEENVNDTPFEIAEGYDGFLADMFAAGIILLKMVAGQDFLDPLKRGLCIYFYMGSNIINRFWQKYKVNEFVEN
jgi:serine/threonine protein kinase